MKPRKAVQFKVEKVDPRMLHSEDCKGFEDCQDSEDSEDCEFVRIFRGFRSIFEKSMIRCDRH